MKLFITGEEIAAQVLAEQQIQHCCSIGTEGSTPPLGFHELPGLKVRLEFDDIEAEKISFYYGPTEQHVKDIILWATTVAARPEHTLIHCAAGISRSAAAALILLAIKHGPGNEHYAVSDLYLTAYDSYKAGYREHPGIRPNRRIVHLADKLLGRNNKLITELNNAAQYRDSYELH